MTLLRRRLAETIAWCRLRASAADPKNSLRTPALRPANLSRSADRWGNFDYDWGMPEDKKTAVSAVATLAETRAELLRQANASADALPPNLGGGRLLIDDPEASDVCGLSGPESEGFIDALDVPPWDTWIGYFCEPNAPDPEEVRRTQEAYRSFYNKPPRDGFVNWQPPATVCYLLCWIPDEFVSLVDEGIKVNPVECFFWASEYKQCHYNTELLRRLDAQNLLA